MQHLNLYTQIERKVEPPFSARQQLRIFAVAAAVMVVIYLALLIGGSSARAALERSTAEQKQVAAELKKLQAQKQRLENNPQLDGEISALERDVAFRHRLLASIAPKDQPRTNGFAGHLTGLARQHIDGLWFTDIELQQGGQQMALLGQTREPEYVPRYLQKLSQEPVFEGHNFQVLRMHVPEDRKDVLNFELRAKEVGVP